MLTELMSGGHEESLKYIDTSQHVPFDSPTDKTKLIRGDFDPGSLTLKIIPLENRRFR